MRIHWVTLSWCAAFADAVAGQQAPAAPASAPAEDAAPAYRRLVAALRERFGPDVTLPESEAHDDALGMTALTAVRADWRAAVAAAEAELAAWHAMATLRGCRFARTSAEPMQTEYLHALFLPLVQLQALNVAAALQAIADGRPDRLERACASALALARHLRREPGAVAWGVAAGLETQVVELVARAAPLGDATAVRLRAQLVAQLVEQLVQRPGRSAGVAAIRQEVDHLFEESLVQLRLGKDVQAAVARRFGDALRHAFVARIDPIFAAAEAMPDQAEAPPAPRQAELERRIAELVSTQRERARQIEALGKNDEPGADAAAELGLMLATLLMPSLPQFLAADLAAHHRLRAAVR